MSQTVVPKFYSTKKRLKGPVKNIEKEKPDIIKNTESRVINKQKSVQKPSDITKNPESTVVNKQKTVQKPSDIIKNPESTATNKQKPVQKPLKAKTTRSKKVNKITNYLTCETEASKAVIEKEVVQKNCESPRTPKRNLPSPEELTPSKKKATILREISTPETSPSKLNSTSTLTPRKQDSSVRKKLLLASPNRCMSSPKKFGSPLKKQLTPQKAAVYENLSSKDLASIVNESRSKILFSGKLDQLKKSLETFSNVASQTKEFQSNSFKITSVVSSAKNSAKETPPLIQGEPAYKKYSYLAAAKPESSLILPYKYKLLGETFRSLDIIVKMLNNRKEKIIFEKVKGGVQDMMKKNFLLDHLGQIMTVFPEAYFLEYEKQDSYTINKKTSYQLIISPNLSASGNSTEVSSKTDKKDPNVFVYMTPQHLLERKYIFEQNLINITKKHHQDFLKRRKFPSVPDEKIVRWHPEFPVDLVPNIPVGALPEEPETKVCTAKDVLEKIKGSFRGKVEKALQSVVDEQKTESKESSTPETDSKKNIPNKKQNSALKGICTDLLEKIRARESAKIIETMTRSPKDVKRLAMLERVPKIAHILWHYFIAERKAAIPVDVAVDKIIHSFNSMTTPIEVKEHLELIRETMPGWLSYIKTSKGEYLTIDKKKDINVLIDNIK